MMRPYGNSECRDLSSTGEPQGAKDDAPSGRLVDVAVALPVEGRFTYRAEGDLLDVKRGCRVLVPFGPRRVTGYVLGDAAEPPAGASIKSVLSILDTSPVVSSDVLDLCSWAAHYYIHPLGEVIRTALPPGINVSSERRARLTEAGRSAVESAKAGKDGLEATSDRETIAALVEIEDSGREGLRLGERRGGLPKSLVSRLVRAGLVEIVIGVASARVGTRLVERLTPRVSSKELDEALRTLSQAPVQAAVLKWLVARGAVIIDEFRAAFPKGRPSLARLVERGMVSSEKLPVDRLPERAEGEGALAGDMPITALTKDQESALGRLTAALGAGFSPFLLEGVTGSGKTEVYLRLIEEAVNRDNGALVLVPEIALTPQLAGRFRARFGETVAVLHSGLSEGERHDEWWRLRRGDARVAVGVRSAVFAPVDDLAVIVVDEEHDGSFKQEEGFRYHARDLAIVRARQAGAIAVLGSATPSIESMENARRGKYSHLRLPCRVEGRHLPAVIPIDLRREPLRMRGAARAGASSDEEQQCLLSDALVGELRETVSSGKQAILFLNRRGHSPSLVCVHCGVAATCVSCDVSMTLHRRPRRMLCHYCGHEARPPTECVECGGELHPIGVGTQRIEEEVRQRVEGVRVTRLDRDTTSRRGALARLLADFALERSDVLVGTQMVAKGHDFPGVTLVGVVLADTGLSVPDFRAAERTYQLLAQVAGRAGRGSDPGRVLLQSWRPDHPAVRMAIAGAFESFSTYELSLRKLGRWPPFCRLLMVRIEGRDRAMVERAARLAAGRVESAAVAHPEADIEVLGPAPAPLSFLRGRARWQVMVKAPSVRIIRWVGEVLSSIEPERGVDLFLDVDPVGML